MFRKNSDFNTNSDFKFRCQIPIFENECSSQPKQFDDETTATMNRMMSPYRQTDPHALPTSAQIRRKNERRPLKIKSTPSPSSPCTIRQSFPHRPPSPPLRSPWPARSRYSRSSVISPTSAPNTNRHAPNVGNSVEGLSDNNALAIGRGRTLLPLP